MTLPHRASAVKCDIALRLKLIARELFKKHISGGQEVFETITVQQHSNVLISSAWFTLFFPVSHISTFYIRYFKLPKK